MNHLLTIEWKKLNFKGNIIALLIANVVIFSLVLFFQILMKIEGEIVQISTVNLIDIMIKSTFIVWQSVLIANMIVEEFKNKTIMLLYSYPIDRRQLVMAKIVMVTFLIFGFMVMTQIIQNIGMFLLSHTFDWISYSFNINDLFTLLVTTLSAIMLGLLPLYIGMIKKSTIATVVSSIAIVAVVGSSPDGTGGLFVLVPVSIGLGLIGLVFGSLTIKRIIGNDL